MTHFYILTDGRPTPEPDLQKWGSWMEDQESRKVAYTVIDEVSISTVFLGLDYNFGEGEPILYETMTFGGVHNGEIVRYHTKEEALKGHESLVASLKNNA